LAVPELAEPPVSTEPSGKTARAAAGRSREPGSSSLPFRASGGARGVVGDVEVFWSILDAVGDGVDGGDLHQ